MPATLLPTSFPFTITSIRERCLPPSPGELSATGRPVLQRYYWHDPGDGNKPMRGFGMCVGAGGQKSWVAQADKPVAAGGQTRRVVIGKYPEMSLHAAMKKAAGVLADIRAGKDPTVEKRREAAQHAVHEWERMTWGEAVAVKVAQLKAHADAMWAEREKSGIVAARGEKRDERDEWHYEIRTRLEKHTAEWIDGGKLLTEITPSDCNELFQKLLAKGIKGQAKKVLKAVREVWNTVREKFTDENGNCPMPLSPINRMPQSVKKRNNIDKVTRVGEPIVNKREWYEKVQQLGARKYKPNPVRRDLMLFAVFTGLRKDDVRKVRWEDINGDVLHVPAPKYGVSRKFDIPLSDYVVKLLAARKLDNAKRFAKYGGDSGWVFPRGIKADRRVTYVSEPNEDGLPTLHRLRDTFSAAAAQVGIAEKVVDVLTNHKGESVTKGYQGNADFWKARPGMAALREATEKISYQLQTEMGIAQPKADPNAALTAELLAELKAARAEIAALKEQQPGPRLAS